MLFRYFYMIVSFNLQIKNDYLFFWSQQFLTSTYIQSSLVKHKRLKVEVFGYKTSEVSLRSQNVYNLDFCHNVILSPDFSKVLFSALYYFIWKWWKIDLATYLYNFQQEIKNNSNTFYFCHYCIYGQHNYNRI